LKAFARARGHFAKAEAVMRSMEAVKHEDAKKDKTLR
jgi:hypothetical protein